MIQFLWISDIHLKSNPKEDGSRELIRRFVDEVNGSTFFDFLIISGDVAFSGDSEDAYTDFKKLIIDPIKSRIGKIICVPGNHDVSWRNSRKTLYGQFIESKGSLNVPELAKTALNENYFSDVFSNYSHFQKALNLENISDQNMSKTYSGITGYDDEKIVFITLNSAWLSIGSPIEESHAKLKKVFNTPYYEIDNAAGDKFSEYRNQTYGFLYTDLNKELNEIKKSLLGKYKTYYKIIVVHHPPDWLSWEERYKENEANSAFQIFIEKCEIDLILVGHEHTSLVKGNLLFGKTLVLRAGKFLDHDDKKSTQDSWYKILELDSSRNILEREFNYIHVTDPHPFWRGLENQVRYDYDSMKSFVTVVNSKSVKSKTHEGTKKSKSEEEIILNVDRETLQKSLENPADDWDPIKFLSEKVKIDIVHNGETIEKNIQRYAKYSIKSEISSFYYFIVNLHDLFDETVASSINKLYIEAVIDDLYRIRKGELCPDLKADNPEIFIYYVGKVVDNLDDLMLREINFKIENLFTQFRKNLFGHKNCIESIGNSNLSFHICGMN